MYSFGIDKLTFIAILLAISTYLLDFSGFDLASLNKIFILSKANCFNLFLFGFFIYIVRYLNIKTLGLEDFRKFLSLEYKYSNQFCFMFDIFRSEWYNSKLDKLDNSEKDKVSKFEQKLKFEPYSGKPLGYIFFRERKFGEKRVLFLVYEEHKAIFLVTITDKKAQQKDIDKIKTNLDNYKTLINKLMIEKIKLFLFCLLGCL